MNIGKLLTAAVTIAPFFLLPWPSNIPAQRTQKKAERPVWSIKPPPDVLQQQETLADILSANELDASKLTSILSTKPSLDFRFGPEGTTPLIQSTQRWYPFVTKLLLDAGADPDFPDANGIPPLGHLAIGTCDDAESECLQLILERNAAVKTYLPFSFVYGERYATLPFEVWRAGRSRKVSALESALHHHKNIRCIEMLRARGARVDRHAYALWKETRQDLNLLELRKPIY